MEIIKEAAQDVAKAWGVQKIGETYYRLIKYLLQKEVDEGTLLCNTVTGELVLLSREEQALLNELPVAFSEPLRELVEHHFLVPTDYDEHGTVLKLRKILQLMNRKKEITGYTILPTTACNARCFYCYEANYQHISMSEQTAADVVEFIKQHHGDKKVGISWFGGEPTLGMARIDQICRGLCDAGIEYSSSMISNGYLLDAASVQKAKELWKLTNVQITLDGTEEIYNKVKSYVGVQDNPYLRVLRNIGLLLDAEIRVSVRMNLDRHNADDLQNLIAELAERFKGQEKFSAYVWPLFDDCGFDPVEHSEEDRLWLISRQTALNSLIREDGMYQDREEVVPSLHLNRCMADNDASVLISPAGIFAKCEHLCEECLGNAKDGFTDAEGIKHWKEPVEYGECAECVMFPACVELKNCFSCGACFADIRQQKKASADLAMNTVLENKKYIMIRKC